jgi:hypothetical protein
MQERRDYAFLVKAGLRRKIEDIYAGELAVGGIPYQLLDGFCCLGGRGLTQDEESGVSLMHIGKLRFVGCL